MSNPWDDVADTGVVPVNTASEHPQPQAGDVKTVALPASSSPSADGPWNDVNPAAHAAAPAQPVTEAPMKTTAGGALWRGLQDGVPFIDYFTAMNKNNYTDPNTPYADRVKLAQDYRAKAEAADKANGGWSAAAHYGGELAGLLAGGEAAGVLGKGTTLAQRTVQGLGMGAAYGAGSGAPDKILPNAATGAAVGGVVGAAAPSVVNFLAKPISSAAERLGVTGAVQGANRGVAALLRRSPQNADDAAARVAAFRANGIEPSILDTLDQGGKDTVAAANIKAPGGRQTAEDYRDATLRALPGAVDEQVANNIAGNRISSSDLRNMVERSQEQRNTANYRQLDPMRIPLDAEAHGDIRAMLASPGGGKALDMVASGTNADTAAEVGRLRDWAHAPTPEAGGPSEVPLPPALGTFSDSALARFRASHGIPDNAPNGAYYEALGIPLPEGASAGEAIPDPGVTYATIDKVRKAANGLGRRAQGNDPTLGLPGDYFNLGRTIDNHLSDHTADLHDAAKATHGAYAQILDAIDGSGKPQGAATDLGLNANKVNGADFVDNGTGQRSQGNYQNFSPWAKNLSQEQHPMFNADGTPMVDPHGQPITMSARDAARVAAANQVRAQSQRPVSALSTADNFAVNQGQDAKSAALVGDVRATRLRVGGGLIARQARDATALAGRGASPTARLTSDANDIGEAVHAIGAAASVAGGHVVGGLRAFGGMLRRSGINPHDAQAMVESAVTNQPGAVDDFIAGLQQRGISEGRARQLWGVARRAAVAAGSQQTTAPE